MIRYTVVWHEDSKNQLAQSENAESHHQYLCVEKSVIFVNQEIFLNSKYKDE